MAASGHACVKIAIAGALGRMGQAVAKLAEVHPGLEVAARFERPGVEGEGLVSLDEALAVADVVIDFTTPQASAALAAAAAARGGPALVIGSTGLTPRDLEPIHAAAEKIAIVRSGSFSLGVNILIGLVRRTAGMLGPEDWDIEVFEAHHRHKVDAPSGTAMMLGEAAAQGRGVDLGLYADRVRDGITGERRPGAIGFSVMRGGGIVGEHSVTFAGAEEIITFAHSARDRSLFARGAAQAAAWVAGRGPGLYDMQDVLGFKGG